jgi:hypothetical protein
MALEFRYRFVDFGTAFQQAEGRREADQGSVDPASLFSNELVTDVGGTCCNGNEPLAVIDHHFSRPSQFPSASAAVLHKAKLIRDRFAGQDGIFWLVTHRLPDFDAFCSMYLARWILSDPDAIVEWRESGLNADGWSAGSREVNWYDPELRGLSAEQRWPLLMASYAAIVDNGRHFPCPRSRALHSILYAALKRGRDYLSESSGATEFLDAVKGAIRDKQRNPRIDSVLEDNAEFAPELAMLDREVDAYGRDVRRARKVIVYLQRCEHAFDSCFNQLKERPLLAGAGDAPDTAHLLTNHPRVATDGIYLRDPECLLFKEWARLDGEKSSLGRGFEFTAVAYSKGRTNGVANTTDYFFAIDPERANGRHLYGLWAILESTELKLLRKHASAKPGIPARKGFEGRAGALGGLFSDPWFDGQNYFCTIVATPNQGTLIAPAGVDAGLRDDPVAELVRGELEDSVYHSISDKEGKQVRVLDLSPTHYEPYFDERYFEISDRIEVPAQRRFRFARVRLRDDVVITPTGARSGSSQQIAETLWQILYPDLSGATPSDFVERNIVIAPQYIGVWGERGVAIACKRNAGGDPELEQRIEDDFKQIIGLARDVDYLIKQGAELSPKPPTAAEKVHHAAIRASEHLAEELATSGEGMARTAAQIKHKLATPGNELLRRFYNASGIDDLLSTLRDLNQTAADYIRREKMDEQARHLGESTETVAEVQSKLEWVEVFIIGVYAIELIEPLSKSLGFPEAWTRDLIAYGIPLFLAFTVWVLRPWQVKAAEEEPRFPRPALILIAVAIAWAVGLGWSLKYGALNPAHRHETSEGRAQPAKDEQHAAPAGAAAEKPAESAPAEQPAAPERKQ